MQILSSLLKFPPLNESDEEGLLAIGGDLSYERLVLAYQSGIFPWYEGETILWWSPNPRFVLFPNELKVSKSMQQVIKKKTFQFTVNKAFAQVIENCKQTPRANQDGTWITNEMEVAYNKLHQKGIAISAEAWQDGKLVGGLYGVCIGKVFCGESMFARQPNASKFAFIELVHYLKKQSVSIIDCQVYTTHLESLGARMIDREAYIAYLPEMHEECY